MTARGRAWSGPKCDDVAGWWIDNEFEARGPLLKRIALLGSVTVLIIDLMQPGARMSEDELADQFGDGQRGQVGAHCSTNVMDGVGPERDFRGILTALFRDLAQLLEHQAVEPPLHLGKA